MQVFREVNSQQERLRSAARVRRCCRNQRRHRPQPPGCLEQAFGTQEAPFELRLCHVSGRSSREFVFDFCLIAVLSFFGACISHDMYKTPAKLPSPRPPRLLRLRLYRSMCTLHVHRTKNEAFVGEQAIIPPPPTTPFPLLLFGCRNSSFVTGRFVDIDAFIMNPTFKLERLLDVANKQQQTGGMDAWGELKKTRRVIIHILFRLLVRFLSLLQHRPHATYYVEEINRPPLTSCDRRRTTCSS